jgi:hypothetical protein
VEEGERRKLIDDLALLDKESLPVWRKPTNTLRPLFAFRMGDAHTVSAERRQRLSAKAMEALEG